MNFEQFLCIMDHPHLRNQAEFMVMVAMARRASEDEALCWAGRETIAHEARVTVRCAEQAMARMVARRFMSVVEKGGGRRKSTVYKLHAQHGLPAERAANGALDEAIKGERHSPFKGQAPCENRDEKGERASPYSQNSERHSANETTKGERHSANEEAPYKEKYFNNGNRSEREHAGACLPSSQPSPLSSLLSPSSNLPKDSQPVGSLPADSQAVASQAVGSQAVGSHPVVSLDDDAFLPVVLEALGKSAEWQIGTVSDKFKRDVARLLRFLHAKAHTVETIRLYRQRLPGYLNKAPENVVEPSPSQMLDTFERVIRFVERSETQNGTYSKPTGARGMGAVSQFADGVKSTRRG